MPAVHTGGGYYDNRCIVCSWIDTVNEGYFRVPNPEPHDCPIGKIMSEIKV